MHGIANVLLSQFIAGTLLTEIESPAIRFDAQVPNDNATDFSLVSKIPNAIVEEAPYLRISNK